MIPLGYAGHLPLLSQTTLTGLEFRSYAAQSFEGEASKIAPLESIHIASSEDGDPGSIERTTHHRNTLNLFSSWEIRKPLI